MPATPPATLVLATGNRSKALELRALLRDLPAKILDLTDFPDIPHTIEDGTTLQANALLKARGVYQHCKLPALADDTGLEVAALGGLPGVMSARYAGPQHDACANRSKLLRSMNGIHKRHARFVTVLALVSESGTYVFKGRCSGRISNREMTTAGFGYESIFVPDGHDRCFAQLTTSEKNAISHRGAAARKLISHFLAHHDRINTTSASSLR